MSLHKASHRFFDPGSLHARWQLWMQESLMVMGCASKQSMKRELLAVWIARSRRWFRVDRVAHLNASLDNRGKHDLIFPSK
jgi:hypothetical protein